ncbi:MAG: ABC-three component system protein [Rubripirellula sp.]
MAKKAAKNYDASKSAIGYLHQCRYGLLLALERHDASNKSVSIEKLDDVAIHSTGQHASSAAQLFQTKHHVSRQGGTSNLSLDIWKTLRVWSDAIVEGKIDLDSAELFLVTTSNAKTTHAISNLSVDVTPKNRKPEVVRRTLEAAAKSSQNATIQDCLASLKKLSVAKRKRLFKAITFIGDSPGILDVRQKIERNLWAAVDLSHIEAFVDQVEGWWFSEVIRQLSDPGCPGISLRSLQAKVNSLREDFRRDNLPDELLHEEVPEGQLSENDRRIFVKQLRVIGTGAGRVRKAQENHYRAVTQRSRWIRNNLIDLEEWDRFEMRLLGEWEEFYMEMVDGLDETASTDQLIAAGDALFKWANVASAAQASLCIRSEFRSPYLTRGSFHMLADQLRLGWHRDFKTICKAEDAA